MKNIIKSFVIALLFLGIFTVGNVSAQSIAGQKAPAKVVTPTPVSIIKPTDKFVGTDAKGNNVFKDAKGNYYINGQGIMTYEPQGTKITPPPKTATK